jgi:hypothetical protein
MSGRQRLPAGEPRKASQRRTRRAAPAQVYITRIWRSGDKVHWRDRVGEFQRDLDDGENAEILISDRIYRVRLGDLSWTLFLSRFRNYNRHVFD